MESFTEMLSSNWQLILAITGLNLSIIFGAFFTFIKRIRDFTRRSKRALEKCERIIENNNALINRITQLADRYHELFHTSVHFPDSSQFELFCGVYFCIGDQHYKNSPCLITQGHE